MTTVTLANQAIQSHPSLWRNSTFLSIWAGNIISILGDGFHSVALGLWVLQTTGSAAAMATVMAVRVIVGILLGAVAGTVVDRADRRSLMIGMNLIRGLLVAAIAWLVSTPGTPFWVVVALSGLMAVCGQFFGPAFQASLVNIVGKEELPRASGLLQVSQTLAQVVGPFAGGTVVAMWGGWAALTGDSASFLVSALLILLGGSFVSPRRESGARGTFWSDMREGFAYIGGHPMVRGIVTLAPVLNFFGNAVGVLLPVIALRVWMASPTQFGAIEAVFPLGFALGAAAILARSKKLAHRGKLMLGSVVVTGLTMTGAILMPSVTAALPLILLTGLVNSVSNVLLQITLQGEVPAEVQGRVFGTLTSLVQIATPASMLIAGFLGDLINPVTVAAVGGLMMALVGLLSWFLFPTLRRYS